MKKLIGLFLILIFTLSLTAIGAVAEEPETISLTVGLKDAPFAPQNADLIKAYEGNLNGTWLLKGPTEAPLVGSKFYGGSIIQTGVNSSGSINVGYLFATSDNKVMIAFVENTDEAEQAVAVYSIGLSEDGNILILTDCVTGQSYIYECESSQEITLGTKDGN